jgi:cytochrome o ubiquinol oxidase subunit II
LLGLQQSRRRAESALSYALPEQEITWTTATNLRGDLKSVRDRNMRRTKRWNYVTTICGKAAGTSLHEVRSGIGTSIHLTDCPASKRPKLFFLIANATTLLLLLAGCSGGVLEPQGPIGAANNQILLNALGIMLVIVVPTIIGVLVVAWWFRASNTRARYQPGFVYSGRIELIVWAIPLLVILFLGGVIWIGAHALDPFKPIEAREKPVEVQVVSLDWKWLFVYPELGVASVNDLVLPVKVPVHFSLTSASVMNMFFVPQLGSMVATMHGMVTQLWLQADQIGEFYLQSSQFSGGGFAGMNFIVHAVPPDRFEQWVATARQAGPALDAAAYHDLMQPSQSVAPFTYRSVAANLFDDIATQKFPPGPGPQASSDAATVHPTGGAH